MSKDEIIALARSLKYNPKTGIFTWKRKVGSQSAGSIAGTPHKGRYIRIMLNRKAYAAHRLAWLWIYGEWPSEIDHINGDGFDNRINNLRQATRKKNMQNQRHSHRNNKTSLLGVHKQGLKYRSRILVNGRNVSLGMFATPEEAHQAYLLAKSKFHEGAVI